MNPLPFAHIIGNDPIKNYLTKIVAKNKVGHALLFSGPEGIGKSLFAQALCALLIGQHDQEGHQIKKLESGQHPDIHVYRPEGKLGLHSIDSLRKLSEEAHYPPYETEYKIFIIHDAERMPSTSANALLKTFEEPPERTKIILLTHAHTQLLPTILSRCATFFFQPISHDLIENYLKSHYPISDSDAKAWAALSKGSLGRAILLAKRGGDSQRTLLFSFLSEGKVDSFKTLSQLVKRLVGEIESHQLQVSEEIRHEQEKLIKTSEKLTAVQKEALEKELNGLEAMALFEEMNTVFERILSWYRDLHLILLGGRKELLLNPDYELALNHVAQSGNVIALEAVQKAICDSQLALQRSVSLSICLENLFLKLNLLN